MPYKTYPGGQPQITVLKVTIPPHTVMKWHSHPIPNAGYILAGDLTIEKKDGTRRHFVAGQAITETVDSVHRGLTGSEPAVLIVFYSGVVEKPLFLLESVLPEKESGSDLPQRLTHVPPLSGCSVADETVSL